MYLEALLIISCLLMYVFNYRLLICFINICIPFMLILLCFYLSCFVVYFEVRRYNNALCLSGENYKSRDGEEITTAITIDITCKMHSLTLPQINFLRASVTLTKHGTSILSKYTEDLLKISRSSL